MLALCDQRQNFQFSFPRFSEREEQILGDFNFTASLSGSPSHDGPVKQRSKLSRSVASMPRIFLGSTSQCHTRKFVYFNVLLFVVHKANTNFFFKNLKIHHYWRKYVKRVTDAFHVRKHLLSVLTKPWPSLFVFRANAE